MIVREIFDRAISGEALSHIAQDLNRHGVPTKQAGRWAATYVKAMLRRTS